MSADQKSHHNQHPTHDDVADYEDSPPSENPSGDTFNISLSVPENIVVRMVDASNLDDYDIWVLATSILSSAVVGFVVAYLQGIDSKSPVTGYYFWTALVFFLLFGICLTNVLRKRSQMRRRGRIIQLKTSSVATERKRPSVR